MKNPKFMESIINNPIIIASMRKLDQKDIKLIYHLSINSRDSHKNIAKKIGLSESSVTARIARLEREKIIKHHTATINLAVLKHNTITMLLRFDEDIYDNPDVISYFENHDSVIWLVSLSGQWDLFVQMSAESYQKLFTIIYNMKTQFESRLNTYKIFFSDDTFRVEHLVEHFYHNTNLPPIILPKRETQEVELDQKDSQIISSLCKNSSLNYLQLGKQLGLTFDIVRYRILNLIKKGVIVKFFAEIDLSKLGYTQYLFRIQLENSLPQKYETLRNTLKNNSDITFAFYDICSNSFVFVCAFFATERVDNLLRTLRRDYQDIITEIEYIIIKDQLLFNLFPKVYLTPNLKNQK